MRCAHCNANTHVLSTRTPEEHLIVRTHRCEAGHLFRTVQVLESVYKAQRKVLDGARQRTKNGTARRRAIAEKRAEIVALLRAGVSQAETARRTGHTQSSVSRAAAAAGLRRPKPIAPAWMRGL